LTKFQHIKFKNTYSQTITSVCVMDLKSSKWRRPSKNHFFTIIAIFLIQHQLHVSVKCAEATKKVSVNISRQVQNLFLVVLNRKCFQVHIVYMGEKEHEDPAITKTNHYEMLSTLLGRYDLIHVPLESNQMLIWFIFLHKKS
jgi:hypothetical protein